jgi:DUF971 family protein
MTPIPTKIDPFTPEEMFVCWNSGARYALPYVELRFACPCASCIDEMTGVRVLRKETIPQGIKPSSIQVVGRYALQVHWNDGHSTGMYHFDRLLELCQQHGRELSQEL